MQLDDRDIICETDYSPLSNAELAAQIEWHAAAMSGASAYDLERITGPARALLARAEAAEAEAGQLRDELAAMTERVTFARRSASLAENALETARSRWDEAERREKSIFDSAMGIADQRDALAARVAELEARLAALQHAACPHCGVELTGQKLAPFGMSASAVPLAAATPEAQP